MSESFVRILVCRHEDCGASFAWPKHETPASCTSCRRDALWRVADADEVTAFDYREIVRKCHIKL